MFSTSVQKFGITILFFLFLGWGCSQTSNTIVIDEDPDSTRSDTTETQADGEEDFQQLAIGELHPITTFDPLFADNSSTMRTLQMIYEGLVRYDEQGEIVSGMAEDWEVNNDSTEYTFELRNSIYYHDNDAFTDGVGRRMVSEDIRYIFERMADLSVPDQAARLFMNIEGFQPYFRERQQLKNPNQWNLDTIAGIETPDDTTVRFSLKKPDPHFLHKLATPYALIYPREAVQSSPSSFHPIGTGPFIVSQVERPSRIILSQSEDYYNQQNINLNRIEVLIEPDESETFRAFAGGELELLPELGPELVEGVLNQQGDLQTGYQDDYQLSTHPGEKNIWLNHHIESSLNEEQRSLLASLPDSSMFPVPGGSNNLFNFTAHPPDDIFNEDTGMPDTLRVTYTDDLYARWITANINERLSEYESAFGLQPIRVPTRDTDLFYTSNLQFYPSQLMPPPANTLLAFTQQHVSLQSNNAENILFNEYFWWIDLRSTTISD